MVAKASGGIDPVAKSFVIIRDAGLSQYVVWWWSGQAAFSLQAEGIKSCT